MRDSPDLRSQVRAMRAGAALGGLEAEFRRLRAVWQARRTGYRQAMGAC